MYFPAFRAEPQPEIPREVTYTVEYLISQILTTADRGFLQMALQQRRLAQALVEELEFFGQVAQVYMPEVKAYLMKQEWSLNDVAERMVREPADEALRAQLCQPSSPPPS